MDDGMRAALREIVGPENYTEALIDRVSYSYDASDHAARPACAVWPRGTEQVSRILDLAHSHRIAVIPRGAGTSLTGGAVPAEGALVLDLCRMNRILDLRVADRVAVIQPGVVYEDLQNALSPSGFFFPPDPASGSVCTLGGNVATNAGGIRGAKYGTTRDYVLGLEVVLAGGRVVRTGTGCIKSSSGYDLTRLFVGSEGTLGVITEITLKIHPKPAAFETALGFFSTLEAAGRVVAAIMQSGIIPSVLEVLDENTLRTLRRHGGLDVPLEAAMILAETDGYTRQEAAFQMERVLEIFRRFEATRIQSAATAEAAEALWKIRKSAGSTAARLRPNNKSEDVTVPVSRVPELLSGISRIVRRHELPFVVFGHAGDGNLHPRIMYDRSDPEESERLHRAIDEIFQLTCDLGGTLTGEHGIGLEKAPFMALEHDPGALDLMRGIKDLFDPHHILNPGKVL